MLDPITDARGTKPFSCEITLHANLASKPERWRTLIHEAIHCFSEGYAPLDFVAHRGWEEGVVEQLQRLLRPMILQRLQIEDVEKAYAIIEEAHAFNGYIAALEAIRNAFGDAELTFYADLLKTPIRQRYAVLLEQAMQRDAEDRRIIITLLSQYRERLNGR